MNRTIRTQQFAGVRAAVRVLALVTAATAAITNAAFAQTLTTLVNFTGPNGAEPYSRLIADAKGNLFGTTQGGGAFGKGTVFEVVKTPIGYANTPVVLVNFDGTHGASPLAGLVADANGNLFGTTQLGGAFNSGTVFEIAKTATGYASTPTVLVSFNGTDGSQPRAALILDAAGNLFGTTALGGPSFTGTVFEVAKTASGYADKATVLVNFGGSSGVGPLGALLTDTQGNLFGTTIFGGPTGYGTVYEVVKTSTGYASTPILLATFDGQHGGFPIGGLVADGSGNLFGTTTITGGANTGAVFKVAKTSSGYASIPIILASFNGQNSFAPVGDLLMDATGSLFGTAYSQAGGAGGVFKIVKTADGFSSSPVVLYSFHGGDGASPFAGLIADRFGNLFGTTRAGGLSNQGTVFELSGTGFIPPVTFSGVSGTANCKGASTSAVAQTYGGMPAAAGALGYGGVSDLQAAIANYCGQ